MYTFFSALSLFLFFYTAFTLFATFCFTSLQLVTNVLVLLFLSFYCLARKCEFYPSLSSYNLVKFMAWTRLFHFGKAWVTIFPLLLLYYALPWLPSIQNCCISLCASFSLILSPFLFRFTPRLFFYRPFSLVTSLSLFLPPLLSFYLPFLSFYLPFILILPSFLSSYLPLPLATSISLLLPSFLPLFTSLSLFLPPFLSASPFPSASLPSLSTRPCASLTPHPPSSPCLSYIFSRMQMEERNWL